MLKMIGYLDRDTQSRPDHRDTLGSGCKAWRKCLLNGTEFGLRGILERNISVQYFEEGKLNANMNPYAAGSSARPRPRGNRACGRRRGRGQCNCYPKSSSLRGRCTGRARRWRCSRARPGRRGSRGSRSRRGRGRGTRRRAGWRGRRQIGR